MRVRRFIQRPWVSAASLVMLIALGLLVASRYQPVAIGGFDSSDLHRRIHGRSAGRDYPDPIAYILINPTNDAEPPAAPSDAGPRVTILDPDEFTTEGDVATLAAQRRVNYFVVSIMDRRFPDGWWGTTRWVDYRVPLVRQGWNRIRDESVIEPLLAWLEAHQDPRRRDAAARLRELDGRREEIRWGGHVYNAATLVALAIFLISLGWIPGAVRERRAKRRSHLIARGLCPRCRYAISGINAPSCPECGERLAPQP